MAFPPLPFRNALNTLIPDAVFFMFVWEDEREVRTCLALYVQVPDTMPLVNVPGDYRQCKVVCDRVRNAVAALAYWMIRRHDHGFSLDGNFWIDDYCIHHNESLKGSRALIDRVVPLDTFNRHRDMTALAVLAQQRLYQVPFFGPVPPEVDDFLDLLNNFAPHHYLHLKSHPVHEDAMGQSSLFTKLYGLLMALKARDPTRFSNVVRNMENAINSPAWVCDGIQNLFLHQLMRFSSNPGASGLSQSITSFLSNNIKCSGGTGESCLRVRRNGESHLFQDYCGVPAAMGTEEAFRAAIAAATVKIPSLAIPMLAPQHQNFQQRLQALAPSLVAPFRKDEAFVIADAITGALQTYAHSTAEAEAAATAAATYLASQPIIYVSNPPYFVQPPLGLPQNQVRAWQTRQLHLARQNYQNQQQLVNTQAQQAAQTAQQRLQQAGVAPQPLNSRNMFDVRDISNMFKLMEPKLLCILHREMFIAGELQNLAWHWDAREVRLAP